MISDELQELAALHALGMLRGEEAAAFEKQCAENPELAALVRSLRETADGLAFALPPVVPPVELRERLLGGKKESPAAKVIAFPKMKHFWSGWKVAAVAALLPLGIAWYSLQNAGDLNQRLKFAAKEAEKHQETMDQLRAENGRLQSSLDGAHVAFNTVKDQRDQARVTSTKLQGDLTMLQADKEKLLAEVTALQARGLYDQARIALMASTTKPATKATAVSLWDQDAQGGVIVVQNLPVLPADRNYQLWVLDDGQPVSAGLLTLDGKGGGRIEFKARKPIAKPTLFAVTNETRGEKDAPDLKQLVLAGQ